VVLVYEVGLYKDPEVEELESAVRTNQFEQVEVLVAGTCMDLVVVAAAGL
jgi:hypothetical protein